MEASDNGGVIGERMGKAFRILTNATPKNASKRIKCTFRVIPSEPEKFRSDLEDVIYRNGGDVLSGASSHSDYAVTILNEKYFYDNPDQNCDLPSDTFSSVYIYEAVSAYQEKSPLPDLNKYRLTESKYESYDANMILFQQERWSDQTVRKTQRKSKSKMTAQRVISKWKAVHGGSSVDNDESIEEGLGRPPPKKQKIPGNTVNDKRTGNEQANRKTEKTAELEKRKQSPNKTNTSKSPSTNNGDSLDDIVFFDRTPSPYPAPHASRQRKKSNNPLRTTQSTDSVRVLPQAQPPHEIETAGTVVPNSNNESAANEKDTGNEGIVPVKFSPHPSTSAAIKLPTLVTRGFAGPPSGTKIKSKQTVKANPPGRGESSDSEEKDDLLSCDDLSYNEDDNDTSSKASSNYHSKRRVPFYRPEGQRILDLICEHDAFRYTKGNKLWELMMKSKKFPDRTPQSLKEHFRKKIIPNVLESRMYTISQVHLQRLKKEQARAMRTKHANLCPDYKF